MRINWVINDDALEVDFNSGLTAQVYYEHMLMLFCGEVIEHSPRGKTIVADKNDASLIELLNWVEEELKFRASH